jgi:hypothetical protein
MQADGYGSSGREFSAAISLANSSRTNMIWRGQVVFRA